MQNDAVVIRGTDSNRKKILFGISGVCFILMTMPAWIPGLCAATCACLVWGGLVWKLPLTSVLERDFWNITSLLSVGVVVGVSCNFYNIWIDSRYVGSLADILHVPTEMFVYIVSVVVGIFAFPAVNWVLRYFTSVAEEDYLTQKCCDDKKIGISAKNAVLILFVVFLVAISSVLRANFYYQDDVSRGAYGYKQWDYFGRYLSTGMATVVHMGDYLTDIAPLPQLLAVCILAFSGVLVLYIVTGKTVYHGWELAAVVPLGLNPYFLECLSFRFDAPYMAISILASMLPLLYRKKSGISYIFASMLGCLAVCMSYQSATGVFPMLVMLLAVCAWNQRRPFISFCLKSVVGYGAGLLYFKLIIMKPADAGYVSNSLPRVPELLPTFFENLIQYYRLVLSDFKGYWLGLVFLIAVGFV